MKRVSFFQTFVNWKNIYATEIGQLTATFNAIRHQTTSSLFCSKSYVIILFPKATRKESVLTMELKNVIGKWRLHELLLSTVL